ncbi:hypothetical protein HYFRA_00006365 [Hymenoscyphus fraxineus]|uniref:Uncharacterized protein n=1 Tax=Hymenoscyphus fraxineus TaxID=746836 RepID=A0A9N9KQM6_9HELO|nr:hypothetical protein HYFRA_00006365 [Hymenoscyphus fraxineus]
MNYTILTLLTIFASVMAAPIAVAVPDNYGSYGDYPEPAGGYGEYPAVTPAAPAGGYGDYPTPVGGYGEYPVPAGGLGNGRRMF